MYISSCLFSLISSGLLVTSRCILSLCLVLSCLDVLIKDYYLSLYPCLRVPVPPSCVCTVTKDPIHAWSCYWSPLWTPWHEQMVNFCLRIVQIFNFFGTTTKVLRFVVLWCDTPKLYFFNWKLHVKLRNHGKLCKCVLQTANDRLAWNSKVINWHKRLKRPMVWQKMSSGVTPVLSHHRTKMSHQRTGSL